MVGLTITYNFVDGLDGLAAIAGPFLCGIALAQDGTFVYATSCALVAAALAFMVVHFYREHFSSTWALHLFLNSSSPRTLPSCN